MTNRTARTFAALLLAIGVAACSTSDLLDVETPDQITPDQAGSAVGAAALRVSAIVICLNEERKIDRRENIDCRVTAQRLPEGNSDNGKRLKSRENSRARFFDRDHPDLVIGCEDQHLLQC